MQTNDSNNERKNSKRTLILLAVGGVALAGALTAGFMLGGRAGGSADTADAEIQVSPTTAAPGSRLPGEDGQPAGGELGSDSGFNNGDADNQPAPTETPASDEEPDGPTVTPDPDDDGCNFCEDDGDFAPQPTSTPSCAFCPEGLDLVAETPVGPDPCFPDCVADVDLGVQLDVTPPIFESISTVFCYPVLQVLVEVDAPAEVWFEYSYNGVDYESNHMDAANDVNIGEDMEDFDWGVYLINVFYVHAIDLSGNHSVSEAQAMPDPDLGCN